VCAVLIFLDPKAGKGERGGEREPITGVWRQRGGWWNQGTKPQDRGGQGI